MIAPAELLVAVLFAEVILLIKESVTVVDFVEAGGGFTTSRTFVALSEGVFEVNIICRLRVDSIIRNGTF